MALSYRPLKVSAFGDHRGHAQQRLVKRPTPPRRVWPYLPALRKPSFATQAVVCFYCPCGWTEEPVQPVDASNVQKSTCPFQEEFGPVFSLWSVQRVIFK